MTRAELEHVIRAAGSIAEVEDLVVIGSQAVLGEFPDAPADSSYRTKRASFLSAIPSAAI
jgi:hypothetical protein